MFDILDSPQLLDFPEHQAKKDIVVKLSHLCAQSVNRLQEWLPVDASMEYNCYNPV